MPAYVENFKQWGKIPFKLSVISLLKYGIALFTNTSRVNGLAPLLPASLLFVAQIITNAARNKIPHGRKLFYCLAGVGIPLSLLFMPIILGRSWGDYRAMLVLPFIPAFCAWYLVEKYKKILSYIIVFLMMGFTLHSALIISNLYQSDYRRYQNDVRLAGEIHALIQQTNRGGDGKMPPVAIIGMYEPATRIPDFIKTETSGASFFELDLYAAPHSPSRRVLPFMKTIGINYAMPNTKQFAHALRAAKEMPAYPHPDCVRRLPDVIVVKLPDQLEAYYKAAEQNLVNEKGKILE
jgi:hypothetical protein